MGCRCTGGTDVTPQACCSVDERAGIADAIAADVTRRKFLGACCATGFGIVASGSIASLLSACGNTSSSSAGTIRVGHLPAGCIQHLLLAQKNGLFKKAGLNVQ